MTTCTTGQYEAFRTVCFAPDFEGRSVTLHGGEPLGLVDLPAHWLEDDPTRGYYCEATTMVEEGAGRRLLFVRISSFDLAYRDDPTNRIDYCIPAGPLPPDRPPAQQLHDAIPFGGAWSDSREEGIVVFDERWIAWFRALRKGVAFCRPDGRAVCLWFDESTERDVREFRG